MEFKTLNNGNIIPMLGYGVFEIADDKVTDCVIRAVEHGYRHIDTAQVYGNEAGVGRAISACGVAREELFITSKVWVKQYGYDKTLKSIDLSLEKLQTDYIDLMLLHRPYFDYVGAWKALETALHGGKVCAVGLSNFTVEQTKDILAAATVKPVVNQIELHPYFAQKKLKEFLLANDIAVEAWYPLGHGNKKLINDPLFEALARKYGKTPAQIILRWHVQSGNIIFPKTLSDKHMDENLEIFSFALSDEDMRAIDSLDKNKALFAIPDWVQKLQIKLSK